MCAIGATLFWASNFIFARELNQSVAPVTLAFWRWLVAVLVLFPFAIKPLIKQWPLVKNNLGYLTISAFLGVTMFNTMLYFGSQTSAALNLSLISITTPVFIVIFARIFYAEILTIKRILGILLVATGVIVLITRGQLSSLVNLEFRIGDLWMLIGAMMFALYSILLIKKPEGLDIRAFQLSTFVLGVALLLPLYAWEYAVVGPPVVNATVIGSIVYLGIFASLVSYVLWNQSVLLIGASKAGMIYYTIPLTSGILAWYFLGEKVGLLHVASGTLIISGIFLANYEKKKIDE